MSRRADLALEGSASDGTRTRDLRRDRPASLKRGGPRNPCKWHGSVPPGVASSESDTARFGAIWVPGPTHSLGLPKLAVVERRLRHPGDSDLDRHLAGAVAKATGRGWRLDKSERSAQIDAVVALAMAVERAQAPQAAPVQLLGWI